MSQTENAAYPVMKQALEAYLEGGFPQEDLLNVLKWEMATAEDWRVLSFIAEVKDLDPDGDLTHAVRRTYEYVRLWEFPEEQGLSEGLPEAIECTLPELIQSVAYAILQLGRTRNMLAGLNIRLDLRDSDAAFEGAMQLLSEELEVLEVACERIGNLAEVARKLPSEGAQGRPSWTDADGVPLSPKELLGLSNLARRMFSDETVTYQEGIRAHSTPPQLVTERIMASGQLRVWDADKGGLEEQARKAMSRTCPRCNSAPGASCQTPARKPRTMHKGRFAVPV